VRSSGGLYLGASCSERERQSRRVWGLCPDCGVKPDAGHVYCELHKALRTNAKRKSLAKRSEHAEREGLCIDCLSPAIEGKRRCVLHARMRRDATRQSRSRQAQVASAGEAQS